MAPPSADVDLASERLVTPIVSKNSSASRLNEPLKYTGTLDDYKHFDVTSVIGLEFPKLQLTDILHDDAKIRDLAVLEVSQRGVVFFRNQSIDIDGQKLLGQKLGELTGKPITSGLHRHALSNSKRGIAVDENGRLDDEISVISSEQNRKFYQDRFTAASKKISSHGWHADITFEHIPSDYAILKIIKTPEDAGGDTLWASGYEAYDRLSPAFQRLAESLTATHYQPAFNEVKAKFGEDLIDEFRGAPENTGLEFKAEHPVIRTNPVTGWKSLFGAGHQVHAGWYNGVTERESDILKDYFNQIIFENHDLQVRFRWNQNDLAIWDNDYAGKRQGNRVVSLGEKPYFDPSSVSRREALGQTQ
ncbi:hypothetical protein JX265_000791 [Neoarthrinium moseri]|uniref:TauD/TfdA-like domain-containing protein n=1 Tax=Neoarthrinium moseri TaxID=1658444 RepID=A0A9P9WWW4_9PEZI|nr:hypothetical protein JX265_000791 [Neoarthrinium moseri]